MKGFAKWLEAANIRHIGNWDRQLTLPFAADDEAQMQANNFKGKAPHGWSWDDYKLLTNSNAVEKIQQKWAKCPQDIQLYVYRGKGGRQALERGQVNANFLQQQLGLNVVRSEAEMRNPRDIYVFPDAINMVYANNLSGSNRIPFTAWTAAHRFAHVMKRDKQFIEFCNHFDDHVRGILKEIYGVQVSPIRYMSSDRSIYQNAELSILRDFAHAIGTMKSTRDASLVMYYEFHYELLAQYIIEGQIRFNQLPPNFGQKFAWGRPSPKYHAHGNPEAIEEANNTLKMLENDMTYLGDNVMSSAVGNIYVM